MYALPLSPVRLHELARLLYAGRVCAGFTRYELAQAVGILPEVYFLIERARLPPSLALFQKLCGAVKLDPEEMLALVLREDDDSQEA